MMRFLAALCLLMLSSTAGCQAREPASPTAKPESGIDLPSAPAPPIQRRAPGDRTEIQASFAPVATSASPAVVNVFAARVERNASPLLNDPMFRRFFGDPGSRVSQSLGSGVIVRADGVIVTNNHVVEGAAKLKVVLADRREFDARPVLTDPRTDLAILKIEPKGERLATLSFANTRNLKVGDLVLAIGNPFGVGQTVTSGIISALGRSEVGINDYAFFIQTDAAINPGNSGGALVDMSGALVGVNTAIFSKDGGSNGIGFAIPAEMVKRVVESALSDGKVVRPWLGVKSQPVTQDTAKAAGLDRPRGVLVSDVFPGGPGDRAGIKRGDVIVSIDGADIFDEAGVRYQVATQRPGAQVKIQIVRGGARQTVSARADAPPRDPAPDPRDFAGLSPFQGTRMINLSPATAEEAGLDSFIHGVMVQAVDQRGAAASVGLRPGDIVREVNGQTINTTADLQRVVGGGANAWKMIIERGGQRGEISVRL